MGAIARNVVARRVDDKQPEPRPREHRLTAKLEAQQLSVLLAPESERAVPEPIAELEELEVVTGEPAAPPRAAAPARLAHTLRRSTPEPASAHEAETQPMHTLLEPVMESPRRGEGVWLAVAVGWVAIALGLLVVAM